jgi:integrase
MNTHPTASMAASINEDIPAAVTVNPVLSEAISNDTATSELDAELAIDLDATSHPDLASRLFWDNNKLVRLEGMATDCSYLLDGFSPEIRESFKLAVLRYRADGQIGLVKLIAVLSTLRTSAKAHPTSSIDVSWVAKCLEGRTFRIEKRPIRLLLQYWRDRYSVARQVVSMDALNLLAQAETAGAKSDNVNSDDPEKSWLTDEEYDDALRTTWTHYDATGDQQSTLIRLLSLQYARRPAQLAGLKFSDLKSGSEKEIVELSENEIHFPSVKEHSVETEFRGGKFEAHPISDHLWDMLKIQKKKIQICFESVLHQRLTEDQVQLLPVFTNLNRVRRACRVMEDVLFLNPSTNLGDELFHLTVSAIGSTIGFKRDLTIQSQTGRRVIEVPVLPISARTGHPIYVHSIRLRHTRVRQLARQGVPRQILSHWLGHTSDEALNSYYIDPAEEARQIDAQLAPLLIPIAQAFTGTIIATDAEATHPHDPLKRLDLAKDNKLHYVGRCGNFSFCATTSIPIPCYRCKHFEPLVDAPHEEVLDALNYRQAQEQAVVMKSGSMRNLLIPIDLSDDIRAVERCIALCKAKRAQQATYEDK